MTRVATGGLHFKVKGNLVVTANGREIVRYFCLDRDIIVGKEVKVLGTSCIEGSTHLGRIDYFEAGKIGASACDECESLLSIEIPAAVTFIEEGVFDRNLNFA
jgi:hypothetical protein